MGILSKVKSVQASGTWNGNDGTVFYRHDYVFEDGVAIQASHKDQNKFNIGDEVEYEVKREHPTHGKSGSVSKPQAQGSSYGGSSNSNVKGIKIGHAITNAVNMVCAQGTGGRELVEAIKENAKMIYIISEQLNNEL